MDARSYLEQIQKIDKMIENKMIEKEQWESIATGTAGQVYGERVQTSVNRSKMSDAVIKAIGIEKDIERLTKKRRQIMDVIERLPAAEYDLVHKVYVQGLSVFEVAEEYGKSYQWGTKVHRSALRNVQEILKNGKQQI